MKWPRMKFSDLYALPSRNGLNRPSRVRGEGCKMVNMGELFANDRIGNIPMDRVQMSDRELENCTLAEGDLLFARQSLVLEGAGKCSYVLEAPEPTTFESHLIRVRLDNAKADSLFYYYLFASPYSGMSTIVQQCAQAGIRGSELGNLEVIYPNPDVQREIARILGSFDDLMDNNERRIARLEEAARVLYQEWFVRLRFPGREHTPIVNGLPQGWERQLLGDRVTLNYGKALKADIRVDGPFPVYGSSGIVGSHETPLVKGPGIVLGRKGNVGSVYWSSKDFYAIDTVYFISAEESDLYLYYALKYMHFISTDVAVPGLNRDLAYSRPFLVPSKSILCQFLEVVSPIHQQLDNLEETNQKLRAARELLLPRLMSGEITV